jgi:DNA-binding NarL/FixJ family response regulator
MNTPAKDHPALHLLLADDHGLFRDALALYLKRAEPNAVIHVVPDLATARQTLATPPVIDCALLDWHMPGVSGMEDLVKIAHDFPKTRMALMSGVIDRTLAQNGLDHGLWGYFPKTLPGREMIAGVRQILKGERFIPHIPGTKELMASNLGGPKPSNSTTFKEIKEVNPADGNADLAQIARISLTGRELDVLRLVAKGLTNAEIADQLAVKEVTIKLHLSNTFDKIGVRNRTEAAMKCKELGLVDHA